MSFPYAVARVPTAATTSAKSTTRISAAATTAAAAAVTANRRRSCSGPNSRSELRRHVCTACLQATRSKPQTLKKSPGDGEHARFSRFHRNRLSFIGPVRGVYLSGRAPTSIGARFSTTATAHSAVTEGPIAVYDERVESGQLRDDEHQRAIVEDLQDLHETLRDYEPPEVVRPRISDLKPARGFLGSLLGKGKTKGSTEVPANLPKGLYMYGDVGSGKTMLMDLFYDTLPANIKRRKRIHFHNFMQEVHQSMHEMKAKHGTDLDAILFVAAEMAEQASVLCFDEFQCTDVADAMILRRLLEGLMSHGTVIVTTSNRHPDELYQNGIQRQSFIPCIDLLKSRLRVLCLDSHTDYRKIPRPPSGVYHHPLDKAAKSHAEKWFSFLGSLKDDPPHKASHEVWGRTIEVPKASGKAAWFTFDQLLGRATGAADYLELMRNYDAFVVTDVPSMTYRERDLARRFITFIDAVYESRAKLVLTTAVPLYQLFLSPAEIEQALRKASASDESQGSGKGGSRSALSERMPDFGKLGSGGSGGDGGSSADLSIDSAARIMMDDLGLNMDVMVKSGTFSGDEERFAFARALSRLAEMGSQDWVERGLGLEARGGKADADGWSKVRSRWREDSS